MDIAYDGTAYSGWQRQPNAPTVQQRLEEALSILCGQEVGVTGCGRTDAGVHARFFPLHFEVSGPLHEQLRFRLNQMLPNDIAVLSVAPAEEDFHARFSAKSRAYEYVVDLEKNAFGKDRSLLLWQRPDIDLLNKCAAMLLEHTDFEAFSRTGSDAKTSLCDLMEARWYMREEQLVFYVRSNRFLRNMVRALVGTMLEVGLGKRTPGDFRTVIESRDRTRAGKSAAAHGLYLIEVNY